MRYSSTLVAILLMASLLLVTPAPVSADGMNDTRTADGSTDLFVYFGDTDRRTYQSTQNSRNHFVDYAESRNGVSIVNSFWITSAVLVEVEPGFDVSNLNRVDGVRTVTHNTEVEVLGTPSTALSTSIGTDGKYGLEQIGAPDTWSKYGTQGDGVNVAVLDTGVNVSHPDLTLRTTDPSDPTYPGGWAEFDAEGNRIDSEPSDPQGHGTHVSGIVAGEHTGVAPDANLMHGSILQPDGSGTLAQALAGIEWAVENNADVVTMSLGGEESRAWIEAVQNANSMGVVVVSSIGNDGNGTSTSPGNVYGTVSSGSVDTSLNVPKFSSGERVKDKWDRSAPPGYPDSYTVPDVVAAGVSVNSTSRRGGYTRYTGTSMSSPHVAGTVALMMSASADSLKRRHIRNALRLTAYSTGNKSTPNTRYGFGVVNSTSATEFLLDDATLSVAVRNVSGKTVEDSSLYINRSYVSDSDGTYSVGLSDGTWLVEATASGYADTTERINLFTDDKKHTTLVLRNTEPYFEVSNLIVPAEVEVDQSFSVGATVTNTGNIEERQDIELRLGNGVLDQNDTVNSKNMVLQPGESLPVTFEAGAPSKNGTYRYGVFTDNNSATGNLTVGTSQETGSVVDRYRNDDGKVDTRGLQDAINDFLDSDIGTGDLQDVINAFLGRYR